MTDSIKIYLPLDNINLHHLTGLPVGHRVDLDDYNPKIVKGIIYKKRYIKSPLEHQKYCLKVITKADNKPCAIEASVNVPTLLVGQNAEHGLSVVAAVEASLLLIKHFLASHGVARTELDKLEEANVMIQQITLTYLIKTENKRKDLERLIKALCILYPVKKKGYGKYSEGTVGRFDHADNKTIYCNRRESALGCYAKPDDDLAEVPSHAEFGQSHIRVELVLHGAELRDNGWERYAAWKGAHESGLYKRIFEEYVQQRFFRLDEKLRQTRPDATDIKKLTGLSLKVFNGYAKGKDSRTASEFVTLRKANPRNEQKLFSEVKIDILKKLRMDITIPFAEHIKLGTSKMRELVVWEGDHNPADDVVELCFCRSNWPALKQALDAAVTDACEAYKTKAANTTLQNVDPETGEIFEKR
jgi:hypothetical protein